MHKIQCIKVGHEKNNFTLKIFPYIIFKGDRTLVPQRKKVRNDGTSS
jgi:hypothetical protein